MSPMSPKEKIAKLESLLARVKERAEAPRPKGTAAFPAPAAHAAQPAAPAETAEARQAFPSASPSVQIDEPQAALASAPPPELSSGWSEPPAGMDVAPETAADPIVETGEDDMEVEVSAEVVEVDIDIDEPGMMMPAESGAQPVADHVANAAAQPEAELEEVTPDASAPPPAPEPEPEPEPVVPANEVVEPAPSSSPRPIASEQPEAYEEESAPRHTPPPESGKQVAAPSVKPEPSSRKSSAPPPSIEGHTLIGGWREPGMAIPREPSDASRGAAVRVPPPPPPPPPDAFASQARSAASATTSATREPSSLGPVATKPELPESAQVATIEGAAPQLAPSTFGELLDATLAL